MEGLTLQDTANLIVLIGAVLLAFERIYQKLIKKPVDVVKEKNEEYVAKIAEATFDKKIPPLLENQTNQMREERQKEHDAELVKMKDMINDEITPYFEEIERINLDQNEKIQLLTESSRDILRQHIINVYERNKNTKTLSYTEREFLNDCFDDYTRQNGNGYIAKLYKRMEDWPTLDDEE